MDKATKETYQESAQALIQKYDTVGQDLIPYINIAFSYLKEDPAVLELGCAAGRDAQKIISHTPNYLGIDASEEFIKTARKRVPQGKFEVADFESYSLPDNLDIIFAIASLLHSNKEEVKKMLEKIAKALVPGGLFFVTLKYDEYHEETVTDQFGTRKFYFYTPQLMRELAGNQFDLLYEDDPVLNGQKWLVMILKKTA